MALEKLQNMCQRNHFAQRRLVAAEGIAAGGAQRLGQQAGQEVELDGETRAALEAVAMHEAGRRMERQDLLASRTPARPPRG